MAYLTLNHVSKQYKKTQHTALRDISLQVDSNEFLVILGPSGCGKTTLLRVIAGLESATEGEVLINGQVVNDLEPQEREIGMVFQNYALYPHMNIKKNLSFGLEIEGVQRKERDKAVGKTASLLGIQRYLKAKPNELSGGERQRAAMGRAMIKPCQIYLFDEPLSNLDDTLRSRLRPEILRLFHQMQAPFLYVTHDQVDAMTMGTKIAVMSDGRIQQLGAPSEIYERPVNLFVAGFVGTPKMNFMTVEASVCKSGIVLNTGNLQIFLPERQICLQSYIGKSLVIGIRPEDLLTASYVHSDRLIRLEAFLQRYEHLGSKVYLFLDTGNHTLCVAASSNIRARLGQSMEIFFGPQKLHLFDPETGLRIFEENPGAAGGNRD